MLCSGGCEPEPLRYEVSVIDLVVNPDQYLKKEVMLDGYLVEIGENMVRVYLSPEQADHGIHRLSVVGRIAPNAPDTTGCDQQFAKLKGKFVKWNGYMIDSVDLIICESVVEIVPGS
jgi:hypothetical protein